MKILEIEKNSAILYSMCLKYAVNQSVNDGGWLHSTWWHQWGHLFESFSC